jgi:hypothetical protein
MQGPLKCRRVILAGFLVAATLSCHKLPCSLAIPLAPNHLLEDVCTGANIEWFTDTVPGVFYFYTGIPDAYCDGRGTDAWKIFHFGICGALAAPACTTAIAPVSFFTAYLFHL